MANKTNMEAIMKLCNDITKNEGEGSIFSLGSKNGILKIPRWSTGLTDLDNILGGGMPEGRVIELYGAESSGKTSLAYHLCARHNICLHIPIEGCVDCDTEFMSETGWKKISDYKEGEKVLQYNKDGSAEFVVPLKFHRKKANFLWHVKTKNRLDMVISEYHNVVYRQCNSKEIRIKPFHDIMFSLDWNKNGFNGRIPKTFDYSGNGINLSEEVIRLMVAIFADGNFRNKSRQCYMGLTKKRKIKRIKMLLNANGIRYKKKNNFFIFDAPINCKHYPKDWYNMSKEQFEIVIDEMKHWDGCQYEVGKMPSFTTICKDDADFIQFAYTTLGYAAYIQTRDRRGEKRFIIDHETVVKNIEYCVCSGRVNKDVDLRHAIYTGYKTKDGYMYCFTMPSKMWIMRRNNRIIVTGNTFDSKRAMLFGNTPKQMLVYNKCKYGEKAFNRMIRFAEEGIPLEVLDSVPSMQPKEDIEKIRKAVNADKETELRIGGIATLMNKYLPTLESVIENTGTTVIFINQIRDKMNALPFGDNIQTPGGHKLKHSASLRIQVARKGWIEIPNYNPSNTSANEKIGLIMKCKVVKSKVCNPMGECELPLIFERGFIDFADLDGVRKEIMKEHKQMYKEM